MTGAMGASLASRSRVASKIRLCWAESPGLPNVMPRARRVNVARGGFVTRVRPAFQLVNVVATPAISNPRAISPTDWEQMGQEGTSRAASTCSALATSRTEGTVSSTTLVAIG